MSKVKVSIIPFIEGTVTSVYQFSDALKASWLADRFAEIEALNRKVIQMRISDRALRDLPLGYSLWGAQVEIVPAYAGPPTRYQQLMDDNLLNNPKVMARNEVHLDHVANK